MYTVDHAEVETLEVREGVHLTQMAAGDEMSVQHYHFEPDCGVPEHDHEHEQVGVVTQGTLTFTVPAEAESVPGDEPLRFVVSSGETYAIPGGEPHAVENTGDVPAVGYDVFSPPRAASPWE